MDISTPTPPPGSHHAPVPATPPPAAVAPDEVVSTDPLDSLLKQIIGGWFILTDGQGAVSKWAEPAEILFGKEAPEALGHSFFEGLLAGPLGDDAEQWRRFLTAGDPPHARALVEVTGRHAPTDTAFPLEAVFVPVKLDEGFDFSLFLEDLAFELPMNLMLLRMRQQHPVVVRALRAALAEEPQAWDGWRTAGTMVAFRPLAPDPVGRGRARPPRGGTLGAGCRARGSAHEPRPGRARRVGRRSRRRRRGRRQAAVGAGAHRRARAHRRAAARRGRGGEARGQGRARPCRGRRANDAEKARAALERLSDRSSAGSTKAGSEAERIELLARLERLENGDDAARAELSRGSRGSRPTASRSPPAPRPS